MYSHSSVRHRFVNQVDFNIGNKIEVIVLMIVGFALLLTFIPNLLSMVVIPAEFNLWFKYFLVLLFVFFIVSMYYKWKR